MKCNLLHINFFKCCYMFFKPGKNNKSVNTESDMFLTLNGRIVKLVKETKFLGVIIDDGLKWDSHSNYLKATGGVEGSKIMWGYFERSY